MGSDRRTQGGVRGEHVLMLRRCNQPQDGSKGRGIPGRSGELLATVLFTQPALIP